MEEYITTKEVAKMLRRSEWYVKMLRKAGSGPPYYKTGRMVLYLAKDVNEWVQSLRVSGRQSGPGFSRSPQALSAQR